MSCFKMISTEFLGSMTTSVCRHPCLLCPWDPVWPSDPVPPPTPPGTDAVETEPTPKAPEPTPLQPQPSVSNMNGVGHKKVALNAADLYCLSKTLVRGMPLCMK